MKTIALLIFSLITFSTYSQTITNNDIDKFVGAWRWTSGTDTVEIVLQKQVYNIPMTGTSTEILVGWHKYVKNGLLNQSSMQYVGRDVNIDFNSSAADLKTTLRGGTYSSNPNKVFFHTFWDLNKHQSSDLYFELLPNSTTQVSWTLRGNSVLPKNLVLTKQ